MSGMDVLGLKDSNPSFQHKASHGHPYASSISSSASSSSSSVFSLDAQSSISSTSTNPVDVIWENDGESLVGRGQRSSGRGNGPKYADVAVAPELRKHPRRTNTYVAQTNGAPCARPPPCLLRQSERKVSFVDNLVDTASQIVEIVWPLSTVALRSDSASGCKGVLPLRTFIQETLRRSRTSYSTLQVALYYLIKIKPHVPKPDLTKEQTGSKPVCRAMQCGRRMFLAALILASKYLQDRNYSARAWSKISGLNTMEINQNELMFLEAVDWKLHITEALFQRWTDIVLKYTPGAGGSPTGETWRTVLPKLTPELDTVDVEPSTPTSSVGSFDLGLAADSLSPRSGMSACEPPSLPAVHEQPQEQQQTLASRRSMSTLEPMSRMDCPNPSLPSLPRISMLPTPQMTPQSSLAPTPAASAGAFGSRRPSICGAMSQAQNMCLARSTLDQRPLPFCSKTGPFDGFPTAVRRSSLARSTSSASSPESMVSDVSTLSSRSSRSSSVSSASGTSTVTQPRLAVKATLRCTSNSFKDCRKTLSIASPIDETSFGDLYSSPEAYTGPVGLDLTNFSLGTPVDHEAAQSLCELSRPPTSSDTGAAAPRSCRKRGRTGSEDILLQNHVRHLINLNASGNATVLPDGNPAKSFLIPNSGQPQHITAAQMGSLGLGTQLSGPAGIKRACCGSEARKIALNPGMRTEYLG